MRKSGLIVAITISCAVAISSASAQKTETVQDFLALCATDISPRSKCSGGVQAMDSYGGFRGQVCAPVITPTESANKDYSYMTREAQAVVRWLAAHKEMYSMESADQIFGALIALYPCR